MPLTMRHGWIMESTDASGCVQVFAPKEDQLSTEDGRLFYTVSKRDRAFATLMGLNMSQRAPWGEVTVLPYLIDLRNATTDEKIKNVHLEQADPLADEPEVVCLKKPRRELLRGLPTKCIELSIPPTHGLEEHSMRVLVADSRSSCISVELTVNNIEFMQKAVSVQWPAKVPSKPAPITERDEKYPNVCARARPKGMLVYCNYFDKNGTFRTHSRMVQFMDAAVYDSMLEYTKNQVQQFFNNTNDDGV